MSWSSELTYLLGGAAGPDDGQEPNGRSCSENVSAQRSVPKLRGRVQRALARRFGIDARALAALRISLGLLVLADLLVRSQDLVAFYTDAGVLPRSGLAEGFPGLARLSIHTVSGAAWAQALLFVIAGGFAVALLVGYRTRLATVVTFLLLVSLHARNPVLLNAGDSVLRRLLFWSLFLPLGGRWSVDALHNKRQRGRVASVASAALLIQVVIVYTVNAVFKLRGERWVRGEALQVIFGVDHLTVLFGDALAQYPTLLELFGWLWLGMVVASVLLILLTGRARILFVSIFVAMHLGMALTMRLGLFPLISIAALLPFLPRGFWHAVEGRLANPVRRLGAHPWLGRIERTLPAAPSKPGPLAFRRWTSRFASVIVAGLLVVVLVWNTAGLGYAELPDGVEASVDPAEYRWDMFAPEPRSTDGWYVVPGTLESGEQADALHQSPVAWEPPPDTADAFPSHRWFVYLLDLRRPGYAHLRPHFADYLCERWNGAHEDELVGLTIYYVEQPTQLDGPEPPRRVELLTYSCSTRGS